MKLILLSLFVLSRVQAASFVSLASQIHERSFHFGNDCRETTPVHGAKVRAYSRVIDFYSVTQEPRAVARKLPCFQPPVSMPMAESVPVHTPPAIVMRTHATETVGHMGPNLSIHQVALPVTGYAAPEAQALYTDQ